MRSAVKRINAAKGKASQGRLESFFGPVITKPAAGKVAAGKAAAGKPGALKGGAKGGGPLGSKGGVKKAPIATGGGGKKK